jgi:hypothetical protein
MFLEGSLVSYAVPPQHIILLGKSKVAVVIKGVTPIVLSSSAIGNISTYLTTEALNSHCDLISYDSPTQILFVLIFHLFPRHVFYCDCIEDLHVVSSST